METYRRDAERIAEVERNREEARQGILAYKVTTEDKLAQIQGLKNKTGLSCENHAEKNRMIGPWKSWNVRQPGSTVY